uniref:SRCR domain-containing protein n=1 Tax=Catharus ustulatus TaxID=91951 RepID=A0A8C3YAK7_CATUS
RGRGSRAPSSHPQPGPSVPAGSRRVRLVGSSGRCAGRVEVYSGGSWSSVCQEGWDLQDAAVVCRELGCGRALEESLWECGRSEERECGRGVGAGAVCSGQWRAAPEQGPAERGPRRCRARLSSLRAAGSGELRLVGGGGRCAGRVEVKHDGEWGSVCVFDFDWKALWASVVCRQLGCGQKALHFGKGDGPVSVARVNCDGSEAALWECWIGGWGSYKVDFHDWDAAVVCQGFSRLVGGAGACAGQLEVRQGRAWVGVCEDQVDMKAAQVVCRELGCGEPLAMAGSGRFGAASASLWDGGFQCNGTEPLLSACARRPAPSQGCSGRASIICSRKELGCGELERSEGVPGPVTIWDRNETERASTETGLRTVTAMTPVLTKMSEDLSNNSFDYDRTISSLQSSTTAPANIPHGVSIVCSGGCPEKGQRFPCPKQLPQPGPSVPA